MNLFGLTVITTRRYETERREVDELAVRLSRCQSDIERIKGNTRDVVKERDGLLDSLRRETDRANAAEERTKALSAEMEGKVAGLTAEMETKDAKLLDMGKALSEERAAYVTSVNEKEELKKAVIAAERREKEMRERLEAILSSIGDPYKTNEDKTTDEAGTTTPEANDERSEDVADNPYGETEVDDIVKEPEGYTDITETVDDTKAMAMEEEKADEEPQQEVLESVQDKPRKKSRKRSKKDKR